jgi:hypothetical protein
MGVRCSVTASQASFSNVIGEPGHKTTRRQGRPWQALWFVLGVRFSVH